MATYVVDSTKQQMIATGICEQAVEWEDKPGGGRRPSERQARHESTGMPLWGVEVLYSQTSFGRTESVTSKVMVGAAETPTIEALKPIMFVGLEVDVRVNKTGRLVENWRAETLASGAAATAKVGTR